MKEEKGNNKQDKQKTNGNMVDLNPNAKLLIANTNDLNTLFKEIVRLYEKARPNVIKSPTPLLIFDC